VIEGFAPVPISMVVHLLTTHRLPLSDEKLLQRAIADVFEAAAIDFEREVRLGPGDIVDFMIGDVAVEVKIKGARRAIYKQLVRYCGYPAVGSIVLATNVPMGLPIDISGKPTAVAALGRGWL
jgi:hypothetical protein